MNPRKRRLRKLNAFKKLQETNQEVSVVVVEEVQEVKVEVVVEELENFTLPEEDKNSEEKVQSLDNNLEFNEQKVDEEDLEKVTSLEEQGKKRGRKPNK